MSDVLSAASMLLAVLAIMFGQWGPEISRAAEANNLPEPKSNYQDKYDSAKSVYRTKAVLLTLFAFVITAIFAPLTIGITVSSVKHYCEKGFRGVWDYNVVMTSIVAVTFLSGALTGYLALWTIRISSWLKENDPDKTRRGKHVQ